ncbi:hypothetical protein SK128_012728 [Halocaridina rubra]|uniref:Uncharacterized protein n=1 Tax=Halocaridina rubra TaxID=373956 RepID=A0AAN8WVK8_HALRR
MSMYSGSIRMATGSTNAKDKSHATLLWGATGEQEWTAALTTGLVLVNNLSYRLLCNYFTEQSVMWAPPSPSELSEEAG